MGNRIKKGHRDAVYNPGPTVVVPELWNIGVLGTPTGKEREDIATLWGAVKQTYDQSYTRQGVSEVWEIEGSYDVPGFPNQKNIKTRIKMTESRRFREAGSLSSFMHHSDFIIALLDSRCTSEYFGQWVRDMNVERYLSSERAFGTIVLLLKPAKAEPTARGMGNEEITAEAVEKALASHVHPHLFQIPIITVDPANLDTVIPLLAKIHEHLIKLIDPNANPNWNLWQYCFDDNAFQEVNNFYLS